MASCPQPLCPELKIFAGSSSRKFGAAVCKHLNMKLGESEAKMFSEGNIFVRIRENVRGHEAFIIQTLSRPVNDNFMELLFWVDAFKRASASSVTAVIPFFSYAKGDKKDEPRVSLRARVCADMLEVAGVDRVVTMDLHAAQITGFFHVPVDHLYALPVICDYFLSKQIDDLVIVSPDVGFGKQARKFGRYMRAPVAIGDKERATHDEQADIMHIIGDVKNKNALIVDDFTTTGGSLIEAANGLKRLGANRIFAAVSHGVLSQGSMKRIDESVIEELVVTDTIETYAEPFSPKVQLVSVAPLFAEAIRNIYERTSVSVLFRGIE